MASRKKKTFVLDTNVILHDSSCIYEFAEHDIIIPIAVLEELDGFKKGNEVVNFHAREFLRALDALSGDMLFDGGINIAADKGRIRVRLDQDFHDDLLLNFQNDKPDHRILNIAYHVNLKEKTRSVILVSKDVNLRMKAKAIGLPAQDYTTDRVNDLDTLYTGKRVFDDIPSDVIERIYQIPYEVDRDDIGVHEALMPHEYLILRNGTMSALGTYDSVTDKIKRVDKIPYYGITPRNAEQIFALNALVDTNIPLVSITGKAGTGKTLLALAAALEKRKYYRQIYLARPIVPLSNKDIGYLPGDISSKIAPYMQPLYDNLGVIQNQFAETDTKYAKIRNLLDHEKLVITPLAYIRGRSLVKIFFIVDEAQNLTPHEVKTIITRAGEGTKIVFTGDIFQIDHPYLDSQSNGLSYLIAKMRGQKLYAHINLEKGERSELAELASNLL
jgi:PhoH-like ATPase